MPSDSPDQVWTDSLLENPHSVSDKRTRVQKMFAAIAPSYDLNNRLHSLWMDQAWRRRAVKLAGLDGAEQVVDVACGTGDLTVAFAQALSHFTDWSKESFFQQKQVIGIDFTFEMLPLARKKLTGRMLPDDTAAIVEITRA